MKDEIRKIIQETGVDQLTAKVVRQKLEAALGMADGDLKSQKAEISRLIDEVMEEEGDQEEEEEEPPKKRTKAVKNEPEEGFGSSSGAKPKMTCVTKSGEECPKQIKAIQEKMKISVKEFLKTAALEIDVAGNTLTGEPRSFSSGNYGWYLGGKCEISVGNKTVWAQVGCNITIPGSNNWK